MIFLTFECIWYEQTKWNIKIGDFRFMQYIRYSGGQNCVVYESSDYLLGLGLMILLSFNSYLINLVFACML